MNLVRSPRRVRTVTLPGGKRCKLTTEKTGLSVVTHRESDEELDALVRPNPIILPMRVRRYF